MKLLLLMAITADGKIARHQREFPDWTSKADKRMFKTISEAAGVVIMGSRTYEAMGSPLPNRLNVVMTRRPDAYQPASNLMFFTDAPGALIQWLTSQGYETAVLAGGATINSLFLKEHLIDEMMLTIVPRVFGQGLSLFSEPTDCSLSLIAARDLDQGLQLLHYRFTYDGFQ
jgi:dihydrofolate reductase